MSAYLPTEPQPQPDRVSWGRAALLLGLAGANLTVIQFVAMREFASLLGSNELVVLLVACGYFLGLSAGYLVSDRLSARMLLALGGTTLALHLSLPFSARWAVGWLVQQGAGPWAPPFVFALAFLGLTPFYAVFLPRLIPALTGSDPAVSLARGYALELAGAGAGLLLVLVISPARMSWLLTLHLAGLVALLVVALRAHYRWWALLALPVAYLISWDRLDRAGLTAYYRGVRGYEAPRIVASEFSPYQRVDLVQRDPGSGREPYLFLNGNLFYGTRSLNQHNLFVSLLPRLARGGAPLNTLVVAGGSLDCARYLAPLPGRLRVVEMDPTVVRLTRQFIQEPRGGFPGNWELIVDDGKHFLGAWTGELFDVIAVDIPVPSHVQTAALHSRRFFTLARSRLRPGGVFSIALAGRLEERSPNDAAAAGRLQNRVLAGLLATFPHVVVVRSSHGDFAWASDASLEALQAAARPALREFLAGAGAAGNFGQPKLEYLDEARLRKRAEGFAPIGDADLQLVLRLSWRKLKSRFRADEEE